MVMCCNIIVGSRVKVSASRCNLLIKDSGSKYDPTNVDGFYTLRMDNAYERAVCIKLLRLVANHGTFVFRKFAHDPRPNVAPPLSAHPVKKLLSSFKRMKGLESTPFVIPAGCREINLVQDFSKEKEDCLDEFQLEQLASLKFVQTAATDMHVARSLFESYDTDGSGSLDRAELKELLVKVGLPLDDDVFEQAMDMCDIDGSGALDVSSISSSYNVFAVIIKLLARTPSGRILWVLSYAYLALHLPPI
jgi:hypothetical protein